jgi:hypothetical protein
MISARKRENARMAGSQKSGLESDLDGLGTAGPEHRAGRLPRSQRCETLQQRELRLGWVHVTHSVDKPVSLFSDGGHNPRVRMARERDAERSGKVQVLVAVYVTDVAPERLLPEDGEPFTEEGDVAGLHLAQTTGEFE